MTKIKIQPLIPAFPLSLPVISVSRRVASVNHFKRSVSLTHFLFVNILMPSREMIMNFNVILMSVKCV